jgi:hypothetical protein
MIWPLQSFVPAHEFAYCAQDKRILEETVQEAQAELQAMQQSMRRLQENHHHQHHEHEMSLGALQAQISLAEQSARHAQACERQMLQLQHAVGVSASSSKPVHCLSNPCSCHRIFMNLDWWLMAY